MDKILFDSNLMKSFLSKLIKRIIRKKTGADINVALNTFALSHEKGKTKIFVSTYFEVDDKELKKILKEVEL